MIISLILPVSSLALNTIDDTQGKFTELNLEELNKSIVTVRTIGTATGVVYDLTGEPIAIKQGTYAIQGSGFVILSGYIVTAAHVVSPTSVDINTNIDGLDIHAKTPLVEMRKRIILISDNWQNGGGSTEAYIVFIDHKRDIAVLECFSIYFKPLPYSLLETWNYDDFMFGEKYDSFEAGDAVAVWVRTKDEEGNVIEGWTLLTGEIIGEEQPGLPKGLEKDAPALSMDHFATTVRFFHGCSGSPMFVFKDGKPHLVGVVVCVVGINPLGGAREGAYFYGARIDVIYDIIEVIKKKKRL